VEQYAEEHPCVCSSSEAEEIDPNSQDNNNKPAEYQFPRGIWASEKGRFRFSDEELLDPIRGNHLTAQLAYEEFIGDGSERIWGPLVEDCSPEYLVDLYGADVLNVGTAVLMIQDAEVETWTGSWCDDRPETVAEIRVMLRRLEGDPGELQIEMRLKYSEDKDWQPPTLLKPAPDNLITVMGFQSC
jgi:hypothetical protein